MFAPSSRRRGVTALSMLLLASVVLAAAQPVPAATRVAASDQAQRGRAAATLQTAVLAGGCFWGMETVFEHVAGVTGVVAGYAGGAAATAHYDAVSEGNTGHAEAVRIAFDPARISYRQLLDVYFTVAHDPTEIDRQGPDAGAQYRSVVFYADEMQRRAARDAIERLTLGKRYAAPIATQVVPLRAFYAAEEHHQHFAERNPYYPYIVMYDAPKVARLREQFPKLVKPGVQN